MAICLQPTLSSAASFRAVMRNSRSDAAQRTLIAFSGGESEVIRADPDRNGGEGAWGAAGRSFSKFEIPKSQLRSSVHPHCDFMTSIGRIFSPWRCASFTIVDG